MRPPRATSQRLLGSVLLLLAVSFAASGCSVTRYVPWSHHGAAGAPPTASRATKRANSDAAPRASRSSKSSHDEANPAKPAPLTLRDHAAADPTQPYWPFRIAEVQVAGDSTTEAEASLRGALKRDPGYAPALALLSKLYYREGRYQEGVMLLEPVRQHPEALEDRDRDALLAGLALHEEALGNDAAARQAVLGLRPRDLPQAGSALVYVMLRSERPDSASGLATAALDQGPASAVNLNNYGITKLRAADVEGAERAFRSAIVKDPTLPGPYYNLAILHKFYRLDDAAAADDFQRYWSRSHDDPDSLAAVFGRK